MDKIKELIQAELERAASIHGGKFRSSHEAYAVLKEEMEVLNDEIRKISIDGFMKFVWGGVKNDNVSAQHNYVGLIKKSVVRLITEAVQVAAMCEKYLNFLELEGEENANE